LTEKGFILIDVQLEPSDKPGYEQLSLKIKDTGIGIEADKLDKIFHKFTQADGSTTRIYGGTGLGLSISKHIIEMMGGHMEVESVYGEGSSFTCHVPLQKDVNAKKISYDTTNVIGKRALIVDDIDVNRSLLIEHLEAWNMRPAAVKDGVEALIELKKACDENDPYDLIMLDYLMPGMNGQELASVVYTNQNIPRTPMIMLSSCDQPISSEDMSKIDIGSYLLKPVREKTLFDTVTKTIGDFKYFDREKPTEPQKANITTTIAGSNSELESAVKVEVNETKLDDTKVKDYLFDDGAQVSVANNMSFDILVAEDFALNQDVVRLMLVDTVFNPIFANNGQEAADMFKQEPDRYGLVWMGMNPARSLSNIRPKII